MIPCIDIGPLFDEHSAARVRLDTEFFEAAQGLGFIQVSGFEPYVDVSPARRQALKRIFSLPADCLEALYRQKFAPRNHNVYRGWFPLQEGHATRKEGIDMGPDIVPGFPDTDPSDPLREPTPLPDESRLPGWHAVVSRHYTELARLGQMIMRCLARGLALEQTYFDALFEGGISTLRLIHYPAAPGGETPRIVGAAHVDSGLLTLLLQDGVSGLQVKGTDGSFIEVPPREDALVVNFGRLLALWSGGLIRATEHRVMGSGESRHSFPFFYEPRVDARVEPLSASSARFTPFLYGDFLWQATTRFLEFRGMEPLRKSQGDATAAAVAVGA